MNIVLRVASQAAWTWVRAQRNRYRHHARALNDLSEWPQLRADDMARYFNARTLARTRVAVVPVIENPPGFCWLSRLQGGVLDLNQVAGIALLDTVVLAQAQMTDGADYSALLFHEMVHVVQYQALGGRGFLRDYVRGWMKNGRRYRAIPLERDAYELQARFEAGQVFGVEDEVRRRLHARRSGAKGRDMK